MPLPSEQDFLVERPCWKELFVPWSMQRTLDVCVALVLVTLGNPAVSDDGLCIVWAAVLHGACAVNPACLKASGAAPVVVK